jgi:predicted nucleic acid-binding protein
MTELFRQDRNVAAAFITPIEVASGLWRKAGVNLDLRQRAEQRYAVIEANWTIIDDYDAAIVIARSFAYKHGLRAGDAIQLACAAVADPDRDTLAFVTLDFDLKAAARAEGFSVLP